MGRPHVDQPLSRLFSTYKKQTVSKIAPIRFFRLQE